MEEIQQRAAAMRQQKAEAEAKEGLLAVRRGRGRGASRPAACAAGHPGCARRASDRPAHPNAARALWSISVLPATAAFAAAGAHTGHLCPPCRLQGVLEEVGLIKWPAPLKAVVQTLLVIVIVAGTAAGLLGVNSLLAELGKLY